MKEVNRRFCFKRLKRVCNEEESREKDEGKIEGLDISNFTGSRVKNTEKKR